MAENERTSPGIASEAGSVLNMTADRALHLAQTDPEAFKEVFGRLKGVAASALTQAADRAEPPEEHGVPTE